MKVATLIKWLVPILLLPLIFMLLAGNRLSLIAKGDIDAKQDIEGLITIDTVRKGAVLPVTSCVDTKSLIIPEVELPSGKRAYVIVGEFELRRESIFELASLTPINSSCP